MLQARGHRGPVRRSVVDGVGGAATAVLVALTPMLRYKIDALDLYDIVVQCACGMRLAIAGRGIQPSARVLKHDARVVVYSISSSSNSVTGVRVLMVRKTNPTFTATSTETPSVCQTKKTWCRNSTLDLVTWQLLRLFCFGSWVGWISSVKCHVILSKLE